MISADLSSSLRKAIYRREGWRCALCDNGKFLQIHHVIKRSQGGKNVPQNLICLCADCHALVHGIDLRDLPDGALDALDDAERDRPVDVAIVEYMADLYAENGFVWNPWANKPQFIMEGGPY